MGNLLKVATGIELWYEEEGGGAGAPVVLLHGGMVNADTWAMQVPALSGTRRVLRPEQRGHGRTPDPGPITYALMADDTIGLLEQVAGGPADLVGWSDGGVIALHVALARPDLVRKLVVIGANFHHEGTLPAFLEGLDGDDGMVRGMYEALSPDGVEHWPVFKAKLLDMWRTSPTLTVEDVAGIRAPTLVVVGDDDAVSLTHTVELYESLPDGQLAVVPGSSHLVPIERADVVNRLIVDFLDDGSITSMLPLRRAAAPS